MSYSKKSIELAGTVTLGPKGQVVIPADIRQKMSINPGDKLIALYVPERNAIGFVSEESMQTMIDAMGKHVDALRDKIKK